MRKSKPDVDEEAVDEEDQCRNQSDDRLTYLLFFVGTVSTDRGDARTTGGSRSPRTRNSKVVVRSKSR